MIQLIGMAVLLLPCMITDFIQNRMPVWYIALSGVIGVVLNFVLGELSVWSSVGGVLLGAAFMLLSWVTKEAIGYGDGILIAGIGAWSGFGFTASAVVISLLLAGIVGVVVQIVKKRRKIRLPYAPFLGTVCLTGGVLLQIGGL